MDIRRISIKVQDLITTLNWDYDDEIVVEIGGTVVSGIHQAEGANERWSTPFGLRKYNKDAFITIKNVSRSPVIPSKPNEEVTPCPTCGNDGCTCPSS